MDQQSVRMERELQRQYGKGDWGMTFRAGPDAIGILAECILITSRPNVTRIKVGGPGLEYETLSTHIIHCANVGDATFREAADKMSQLADWTLELSEPDGIIDKTMEFSEPGQSKHRDDFLADIIAQGEESVNNCTDAIETVSASFNGWCALTKALHLALRDTIGRKLREEETLEKEIRKTEVDKELKEAQKEKAEAKLREKQEEVQKTRAKKEWYEHNVEGWGLRGAAPAIFTTGKFVSFTPLFAAVGMAAFIHYVTLRADLSSMESAQEKRDQEIRELEESKTQLEIALGRLGTESKSLGEVAQIVEKSISRVTELQQLIQRFMSFLRDMNNIISHTVKRSKLVYNGFRKKDGFVDPGIKREIFKNAFDMKTRFIFASKASDVYNAVSTQYILPILDMLPGLECMNRAPDHEIQGRVDDLHKMRCRISSETALLTEKMHQELKESLVEVTRDSARAFQKLLPAAQDTTA